MGKVNLTNQVPCNSGKTTEAQGVKNTFSKPVFINPGNEIFGKIGEKGKEQSKLLREGKNLKQTKNKNCALLKRRKVNDAY